ncbi:uncharacterized protein [Periplaneta americana]|uniref:uncharacterized protein isoform X1 n=1 Tax=Periplaneta americana TaxID=6978 RepID=UPI0037E90BD2
MYYEYRKMASLEYKVRYQKFATVEVFFVPLLSILAFSSIISGVNCGIIYDMNHGGALTREIEIKQGKLIGVRLEPTSQIRLQPVDVFLGIPYAAAPTGSQRFMPPGSPPQWMGTKLFHNFGPVCPQNLPDLNEKEKNRMPEGRANYLRRLFPYLTENQSEDCLYLNIYAPAQKGGMTKSNPKYPVIVFIHGESFEWNSGNLYDGSILASFGGVVVVTLNFRLGILGFLRPGVGEHTVSNFGLLDQIAALQWIKENIQEFGGDPNSVTLMGHGTGAACVNYLMVSPVSQGMHASGLFRRAILMSGTALADWALTTSSVITIQVAQALNCALKDTNNEMASCLRKKRLEEIMDVKVEVPEFKTRFGPMVDGSVVPNDPFQLIGVYKDLFSRFELLYGVTELESYNLLDAVSLQYGMLEQDRDKKIRSYVQERFQYLPDLSLAETLKAYNVTRRRTSASSQSIAETNRDILLDVLSDARVAAPMVQTANFHSSVNPQSYFYVFSHTSSHGHYTGVKIDKSIHGEELPYVFGVPLGSGMFPSHYHYNEPERQLSQAIMTFWTNFAKTGNPNVPQREPFLSHYELEWSEYDVVNQTYFNLGIPPKIGHHYRQKMMDFWNNRLPDLLRNLPPNESASRMERPEILPPDDPYLGKPKYYNHIPKPGYTVYRPPLIPATQTPVYGTIVSSSGDKSRATSTVLLGVDGGFGSRLPSAKSPSAVEQPQEVETGSSSSMAMSIVIVIGVCLLLVNLCAFAGLYYQRDRLRVQERIMKKRYEDVETTNNDDGFMKKPSTNDECVNIATLDAKAKRDLVKKKKGQHSGDELYEAVRSRDKAIDNVENLDVDDDGGESSLKKWRLSRQCSASTMDPHTKVREWIAHEIVQRCSPRFLRRTKFQAQQPTNCPILQKDNSFHTSIGKQSSTVILPAGNCETNPSSPALSKPTTTTTLQRTKVKKVSVAVDATPAARSASVLKQIPIEQMSKSMEELGGKKCISTSEITFQQKKAPLKRSETCRESLARSSSSPAPSHSPQRDTVLRRSTTSISLKVVPSILKKPNNGLQIVHSHSRSDPVHNTTQVIPQNAPQFSTISQHTTQQICNIPMGSKDELPIMRKPELRTFPKSGCCVNSQICKQEIGTDSTPTMNRPKDINVTSRDSNMNQEEKLTNADPLKNIQRRNFPKVLPDLPQDAVTSLDKDIEQDSVLVQSNTGKRRSLPPPTQLMTGLIPTNSISQPTTPTSVYQKDIHTQTQAGKVPPPPPPRVSSTLGRKPNSTNPINPLTAPDNAQKISKLKASDFPSSPIYSQRPEPRVIIKPTSTAPVTRNLSATQQGRTKQQIPRVVHNTGDDYPLTPTGLHHCASSDGPAPGLTLSRQSSLRSQDESIATRVKNPTTELTTQPQVHKTIQRTDVSTATPPLQTASTERKMPTKKSTETSSSQMSPSDDNSSNTGTVRRVKKTNDGKTHVSTGRSEDSTSVSKGSTVPKTWYAQYNQSFLSKTKDSDN